MSYRRGLRRSIRRALKSHEKRAAGEGICGGNGWQYFRVICHCRQKISRLGSPCQRRGAAAVAVLPTRRASMFDTDTASSGVKFALLEGQLLSHEIDRAAFVDRAANLGLPAPVISEAADKFLAIAANQAGRRAALRSSYDYIVIGSGASGS